MRVSAAIDDVPGMILHLDGQVNTLLSFMCTIAGMQAGLK